jgi:cation:H+ antiporter
MLLAVVLLLVGTIVLVVGAEAATSGAGRLAAARGISPFLVGAVLFGIDVESVGAALIAAGRGETSIAAGEAFGTIVFLFSAAFGAALLLAPGPVRSPTRAMVLMPVGTLLAGAVTISDQVVSRGEGAALVVVYVVYLTTVVREGRAARVRGEHIQREAEEGGRLPPLPLLLVGLGFVYLGASLLVGGGVRIVDRTALSAGFVGAALVGALVAADEVFLEVIPVRRGLPELATGNLFGTVAAFSSGVLGLAALVRPLVLDTAAASGFLLAAVLYTIVATAFLGRGRAGKIVGFTVLAVYAVWLILASQI